ncbi:MAG: HAD-IA family hydrolase [Candidatus Bipolaricaulota bacterium]|nr:HAD-IA family hydrolase [Candidatus Bipolaricaulota bacterium]
MRLLRPNETVPSIFAIDYKRLYRNGKRALLFDLDKTLGSRWPTQLKPEVYTLLEDLTTLGFRVGILTNRRWGTDDPVIVELGRNYPLRVRAGKPRKGGFKEILSQLDSPYERAVMIGDRRMTDIFGANRLGIYSIHIQG